MNRPVRTILAAAAIGLGMAGPACALSATYTFTGDGTVLLNFDGTSQTATCTGPFTLTITTDTALLTDGGGFFRTPMLDGTFTDGACSETLTGITVVVNSNPPAPPISGQNVDFYNDDFLNGLGFSDPSLASYNLMTSFGPKTVTSPGTATSFLTPTFNSGETFATTGSDNVTFTANDSLTFTANVANVTGLPEPATLVLLGLGLAGLGFSRRK